MGPAKRLRKGFSTGFWDSSAPSSRKELFPLLAVELGGRSGDLCVGVAVWVMELENRLRKSVSEGLAESGTLSSQSGASGEDSWE